MLPGGVEQYRYIYIKTEQIDWDIQNTDNHYLMEQLPKLQTGDTAAIEYVALAYLFGTEGLKPDFDKAFTFLQIAAQGGSMTCQHYLADCYAYGIGVTKDIDTARNYYKLSAQSGIPYIQEAALQQLEWLEKEFFYVEGHSQTAQKQPEDKSFISG